MASDLSHRGFHFWEFAQQQRHAALQLGLVHVAEADRPSSDTRQGIVAEGFQHTHGPDGRPHSHVTFVDGLLLSQDGEGPQLADAANTGPVLLWQIPPRRLALSEPTDTRIDRISVSGIPPGQVFDDYEPPPPRI